MLKCQEIYCKSLLAPRMYQEKIQILRQQTRYRGEYSIICSLMLLTTCCWAFRSHYQKKLPRSGSLMADYWPVESHSHHAIIHTWFIHWTWQSRKLSQIRSTTGGTSIQKESIHVADQNTCNLMTLLSFLVLYYIVMLHSPFLHKSMF